MNLIARQDEILTQDVAGELVVYDLSRHEAHRLNPTAALIFRYCDGETSVDQLSGRLHQELGLPNDESLVLTARARLDGAHLLRETPTSTM